MLARIPLLAAIATMSWPVEGDACSCMERPFDLAADLGQARQSAGAIYLGRVTELRGSVFEEVATVEVLEVFEGPVKPGQRLSIRSGGGGDCTFPFKQGASYLLYAADRPEWVGLCSRTREVSAGDSELKWLRTGKHPPVPVAVQREQVTCRPCNLDSVTLALVGLPPGDECNSPVAGEEAVEAGKGGAAFWATGYYDRENLGMHKAVGRSSSMRYFELVQRPYLETRETCRQRVTRRWCTRLEEVAPSSPGEPPLRCVEPGEEALLCDEESSRKARWESVEEFTVAECRWRDPSAPTCELSERQVPLAAGKPGYPLLRCRPSSDWRGSFACEVVDQNSQVDQVRPAVPSGVKD